MPGFVNVGGIDKQIDKPFVNISNSWKEILQGWANVNGAWKEFFKSGFNIVFVPEINWETKDIVIYTSDLEFVKTWKHDSNIHDMATDGKFIYVCDSLQNVTKYNYDGSMVWKKKLLPEQMVYAIEVDAGGFIYLASDSYFARYDNDGNRVLNNINHQIANNGNWSRVQLAIDTNNVYIASDEYYDFAKFNKSTGSLVFRTSYNGERGASSLAINPADSNIYIGGNAYRVYRRSSTGTDRGNLHVTDDGAKVPSISIVKDNQMYVTGGYPTNSLSKVSIPLTPYTMSFIWRKDTLGWNLMATADADGFVYTVGKSGQYLYKYSGAGALIKYVDLLDNLPDYGYLKCLIGYPVISAFPGDWGI